MCLRKLNKFYLITVMSMMETPCVSHWRLPLPPVQEEDAQLINTSSKQPISALLKRTRTAAREPQEEDPFGELCLLLRSKRLNRNECPGMAFWGCEGELSEGSTEDADFEEEPDYQKGPGFVFSKRDNGRRQGRS
jgi:hypothetical protein